MNEPSDDQFRADFRLMTENGALIQANADLKERVDQLNAAVIRIDAHAISLRDELIKTRRVMMNAATRMSALRAIKIDGVEYIKASDIIGILKAWSAEQRGK